jgi:hypothetical protein
MDELNRLAGILEVCADKLELLGTHLEMREKVDELFADLRSHPDLAYLDTQFESFYS